MFNIVSFTSIISKLSHLLRLQGRQRRQGLVGEGCLHRGDVVGTGRGLGRRGGGSRHQMDISNNYNTDINSYNTDNNNYSTDINSHSSDILNY